MARPITSSAYKIHVGTNALGLLNQHLKTSKYTSVFILCDENTLEHCWPIVLQECPSLKTAELIEIESGEASKSIEICCGIWETLLEHHADRNSLLINLGGGVITDLGGFVASTYKRGINFINLPTTLLAMADASVGGKNGVDFGNLKNVIGTITQPKAVFVHVPFLETLDKRQIENGLAEIYKIALISDLVFLKKLNKGELSLERIIYHSIVLKNAVVKKDPLEKGLRKILNFGHTIGHAIEVAALGTAHELLHGEAIVLGMIAETQLSFLKQLISKKQRDEVISILHQTFELRQIPFINEIDLFASLKNDKKSSAGKVYCALLIGVGKCDPAVSVSAKQVEKAMEFTSSCIHDQHTDK